MCGKLYVELNSSCTCNVAVTVVVLKRLHKTKMQTILAVVF